MTNLKEVPGIYMHDEEMQLIHDLSKEVAGIFNPCNIVHIGIGWGGSLWYSRVGAPESSIFGVDIVGTRDVKPDNVEKLAVQVIEGDSREVHRDFHLPVHFLYIDGDHTYPILSLDIKNWTPKVVVGGYVAFHDCYFCNWAPEVNRAIDENLSAKNWEDCGIEAWSRYFRRI